MATTEIVKKDSSSIFRLLDKEEQGKVKKIDFCQCHTPRPEPLAKEICSTCHKVIKQ